MQKSIIAKSTKTNREEKDNCFICGKHKVITEEHYIVPLAEVKESTKKEYEDEIIYICPNCHTYLHLMLRNKEELMGDVYKYFCTEKEKEHIAKIISRYYYLKSKNARYKNENR